MKTEDRRSCSICGNEISGAMEFCPVCMLRKALAGDIKSSESSASEDTVRTTSEQAVQRFEHYELVSDEDGKPIELGRGAVGVTYKAFDVDLRCPVTLKVISEKYIGSESARLRFLREARAAASFRHPNVASVFHLGRTGENYFYAMEFVEGETLEKLIKRSGELEAKLALEIAAQVAAGLAAVHKQKLVHRDIKPSNIMVSLEDGGAVTAKIIDLGMAKAASDAPADAAISTFGAFAGTPTFASPEQFAGVGVDIRSDLYSLGVVLWEMVTGHAVFRGSLAEVMYQHQHASLPLEDLEHVPQPVFVLLEVLLEKDPDQRFQNPVELLKAMPTVKSAIDAGRSVTRQSLREAPLAASRAITREPPMEPRILELRPEPGSLLKNRYRLMKDVNLANPGRIFHAEDTLTRMRVTVRIFLVDPGILAQIDEEADRIKGSAYPNFIQLFAIERERNVNFIVLEWLEGFPLVDLLRARGALTLREMLMLLQQIAPTVDAAREAHLSLEMKLRDIFLHFPESFAEPVADIVLRCPLDEWPAFVVKMSLLEKIKGLEASAGPVGEQTIISDLKAQRDVVQLGIVTYELLGGKPGGFAPLANMSEKGNEVLRKCLTPDRSFSTATEFYDSLRRVANAKSEPVVRVTRRPEPERLTPPRHEASTGTSAGAVPAQSVPPSNPIPASKNHFWPIAGALMGILLAIGAVWIFLPVILSPAPNQEPQVLTEAHSQKSAAFGPHPPPQPEKQWTNSLGMRFVPLAEIYISEWQTRRRDFEAFVQTTGYDAVGGMSSAVTQNGFKLNEMSWRAPGFQQTPDHPVVGVSWEDANQFCAWLTKKERSEGTLTTLQSYRLPTDREWSRAAGLEHEEGNTPEDRSGKIKAVYPWGDTFPPPNDSGNYAGSESRVDTPETWNVIPGFHDAFPRTAPVLAFKANARGLRCIGGNVWEWCMDKLENTMNWRTLRGGSWATSRAEEMLSSYRRGYGPLFRCDDVGFRCVIATDGAQ